VNPRDRKGTAGTSGWKGAAGLAADVRYYGEWMRDRARERIGHLYPDYHPHPPTLFPIEEEGEPERWEIPPALSAKCETLLATCAKTPRPARRFCGKPSVNGN